MTAVALNPQNRSLGSLEYAIEACQLIAPVWPLDQFIAVNPWWPEINKPFPECMAVQAARGNVRGVMSAEYFRGLWDRGVIAEGHLQRVLLSRGLRLSVEELLGALNSSFTSDKLPLITELIDTDRDSAVDIPWQTEITHQISQFCGAYFDQGQASWRPDVDLGLYQAWKCNSLADKGISWLMNAGKIHREFAHLPESAEELITLAVTILRIPEDSQQAYFHSLLLSIKGWAAWCAYQEWQANLTQSAATTSVLELLAIRLAWDLVLFRHYRLDHERPRWLAALARDEQRIHRHCQQQSLLWVWQMAAEYAYQSELIHSIRQHTPQTVSATPQLQAVFCIDVRSEVIRRHLEAQDSSIQTLGFAGFFGLPISYNPKGSHFSRPQLPGLLAPAYRVSEQHMTQGKVDLSLGQTWQRFKQDGPSTFAFVESTGLGYLFHLLKNSFYWSEAGQDPMVACADGSPPKITHHDDGGQPVLLSEKVALAKAVLTAMGLTSHFASVVLLVGHGNHSRNNPHRAGLNCGACGGQTGEVNSRALAHLLNEGDVRQALFSEGIAIPETTCFIPALHNTTTDHIQCFDVNYYQQHYDFDLGVIEQWLTQSTQAAAQERSSKLGSETIAKPEKNLSQRGKDWSQVRPEWGLANNAAFIVAPRSLTRGLDLQGRTFLHDYDASIDENFAVLEQIMTAPMVVTHWINLQYYASVVDNPNYGSGNKVLHNVVGGNIGVFEGNGGDLRTGLSLQSLHNGSEWMHEALRLSVFVQAPKLAIADIVARHEQVRQLVDNEWLYLFQLDATGVNRLWRGEWLELD